MPSAQLLIIAAALAASAIDSEILEINKYSQEQNVSQKVSNTRLNEKHLEKESTERMQEPLPAKSILPSAFSSQIVSELTPCAVYPRGVECYERKERFEYSTSRKRHIVHVSTDKQTYRPGEIVYIRAVVIGALNFKPVGDKTTWGAVLKIMCPIGSVAYEVLLSDIKDSVASTIWAIPRDVAGGEYQIEIFNKKEFRQEDYAPLSFGRIGSPHSQSLSASSATAAGWPADMVTATLFAGEWKPYIRQVAHVAVQRSFGARRWKESGSTQTCPAHPTSTTTASPSFRCDFRSKGRLIAEVAGGRVGWL